jgi:Matrixin
MKRLAVLLAVCCALMTAAAVSGAPTKLNVKQGSSAATTESVLLLHGAFNYPGYWWDHTNLTVAVQDHPSADPALVAAIHAAIEKWADVLEQEFDGLITLTDVSGQITANHKADIVVHYNPTAGGVVFGGFAVCGDHKCSNVIVRSDLPMPLGGVIYSPQYLYWVTLHELGHALGLGHAQPLLTSTDLMGYGWPDLGDPILSNFDIEGIQAVFAWAFEGVDPYPSEVASVNCRD